MKLDSNLIDTGRGEPLILLHGLLGNVNNWDHVLKAFSDTHRVIVPALPFFETSLTLASSLNKLVRYIDGLVDELSLDRVTLIGNSLGGHVALLYALENPRKVRKLVLAGSSGLFERQFGGSFPRIKDYEYIREKVGYTFYKKEVVTKALVDEVYTNVQNPQRVLKLLDLARASQRQNLGEQLHHINTSTLLIWGLQDEITPPEVALEFHDRLPNSHIRFIDECGHAPMMEQPEVFNKYVWDFLSK